MYRVRGSQIGYDPEMIIRPKCTRKPITASMSGCHCMIELVDFLYFMYAYSY